MGTVNDFRFPTFHQTEPQALTGGPTLGSLRPPLHSHLSSMSLTFPQLLFSTTGQTMKISDCSDCTHFLRRRTITTSWGQVTLRARLWALMSALWRESHSIRFQLLFAMAPR